MAPLGFKNVNPNTLWKIKKDVFGLQEAPRLWWLKFRGDLIEMGWIELRYIKAVFILLEKGRLIGILVIHVDDGLCAGKGRQFDQALSRLYERLPIKGQTGSTTFSGRYIEQKEDCSFVVSQPSYLKDVAPIEIAKERKKQKDSPVTASEKTAFRSLVQKLAWPSRTTNPLLAFEVSDFQQKVEIATVQNLMDLNRMLKKAQESDTGSVSIVIPSMKLDDVVTVTFSDASFGNMPKSGSQGGEMIFVCEKSVTSTDVPAALVEWSSKRIHRVVRSTLAAEGGALSNAHDRSDFARVIFAEMMGKLPRTDHWQEALKVVPGYLVVDAKSLFDMLNKVGALTSERRVALDVISVKEALEEDQSKLRWVPTRHMLADVLTKLMTHIPPYLLHVLQKGRLSLVESAEAKNVVEGRMPKDCGEQASDEHKNWRKIEAMISEICCHHCSSTH